MDLSKFQKSLTKSIPGINTGFHNPKTWISTDNYCLNYLISGDFHKGIPLGMVTVFAGESGSGKSLFCSGLVAKNAQKEGAIIVMIDSENALTETWLENVGVDVENNIIRISTGQIDDVAKIVSEFMKEYKAGDDTKKVLFVVDSLGMLETPTSMDQFEKGDMKGDLGRKAKALKQLVSNTVNLIAPHEVGMVCTSHTYASMDMFSPGAKMSGGNAFVYAASILIMLTKKNLKESELDNTGSTKVIKGIKAKCTVSKTRFTQPFQATEIFIPYEGGVDAYSGLFELFKGKGILEKVGNRFKYVSKVTGEEFVDYQKNLDSAFYDRIMEEIDLEAEPQSELLEVVTEEVKQ